MRYGKPLTRRGCRRSVSLWLAIHMTTVLGISTSNLVCSSTNSQRRGVLAQTLIIVTSDHGEGLGEHNLFDHGESLYQTEIRVPLVIVPPSGLNPAAVVDETVSLRDLPATIVDLAGQANGSPFPGESLARFWRDSARRALDRPETLILSSPS